MQDPSACRVLLVEDDHEVADVIESILTDEGYLVSVLADLSHESLLSAVANQQPDCVLLDGMSRADYGSSWDEAAHLAARERSIPTIAFSAHAADVREAREGRSARARAADFAATLEKPFTCDDLLTAVATACQKSNRFDESVEGES